MFEQGSECVLANYSMSVQFERYVKVQTFFRMFILKRMHRNIFLLFSVQKADVLAMSYFDNSITEK